MAGECKDGLLGQKGCCSGLSFISETLPLAFVRWFIPAAHTPIRPSAHQRELEPGQIFFYIRVKTGIVHALFREAYRGVG